LAFHPQRTKKGSDTGHAIRYSASHQRKPDQAKIVTKPILINRYKNRQTDTKQNQQEKK
jgi:hypothetical protein